MKSKWPLYYGASEKTVTRVGRLRRKATEAEKLFWKILRNRNVSGLKFRRQHAIQYYIADFYCHEANLVIELDGDVHDEEEVRLRDKQRQKIIEKLGVKVLRFSNEEVFSDPDRIIKKILAHIETK